MEEIQTADDRVLVLIIYDIVDNRRRSKLKKFLRGYGSGVQKSAFEAVLHKNVYAQLISKIPVYATEEDSIRVYKIIGKRKILSFGKEIQSQNEEVIII